MRKYFGNSMYLYGVCVLVFFSKMTVLKEKKSLLYSKIKYALTDKVG